MEPITTALAAVSAASASIKFLKERISDAQDAKEIFGHVSRLMDCEKAINADQAKHSSVGEISLKSTIDHGIQKRLIRESLQDAKLQIDLRFGPGTYQSFIDDHAKAVRQAKEKEAQARKEILRKAKETEDAVKSALIATFIVICVVALFVFMFAVIARSAIEVIIL
tara:strand:- start:4257 stop:4757 length:501 start_codon:yes stop_codon:yes gene_type:complete